MANRICQFAKNRTDIKIIKFGPQSEFCKSLQDFDLESLLMWCDHSQKVKAPPIRSDYGSKDCVNLSSSTAVSRLKAIVNVNWINLRDFDLFLIIC
jgi:hypothetical protein